MKVYFKPVRHRINARKLVAHLQRRVVDGCFCKFGVSALLHIDADSSGLVNGFSELRFVVAQPADRLPQIEVLFLTEILPAPSHVVECMKPGDVAAISSDSPAS